MQSENWRVARDTVRELEGCTTHVIQPGRGHVMQVTHHKTYNTTCKKLRYRSGTGQIYRYQTGTGTSPNFTEIGTGREPEFRSGPNLNTR